MEPFKNIKSIVTPLDKVNVDTDQIVPKQFLKLVQKSGFGKFSLKKITSSTAENCVMINWGTVTIIMH